MPLLRILTGYRRDDYRDEVPQILYCGYDGSEADRVAESAPDEFLRIELIASRRGQRLRKAQAPSVLSAPIAPSEPEPSKFESLTVKELKERCEELGIDTAGLKLKADFVAALKLDEQLSELTVAQLREKALAAGIDVTGFKLKRDYLDALEAAEKAAASEPPASETPASEEGPTL